MIQIIAFLFVFCLSYLRDPNVCYTPECKKISRKVSQLMDMDVDPCSDFNKFACGGFEKDSEDFEKNSWDIKKTTDNPEKELKDRVKNLLEGKTKPDDEFETDEKVRKFYKSCIDNLRTTDFDSMQKDWTRYYSRRLETFIKTSLKKVGLPGWPYSNSSQLKHTLQCYEVVPKLIEEGLVYTDGVLELPIMNVEVGVDDFDRKLYTLKIDAPDFDIDHNNNGNKLCYIVHEKRICDVDLKIIMGELNPNKPSVNLAMLKKSLEIDRTIYYTTRLPKLEEAGFPSKYLKNKKYRDYAHESIAKGLYNRTTINDLKDLNCRTSDPSCLSISSTKYFQSLFDASGNSNIRIENSQSIIVKDPNYFINLSKTLRDLRLEPYEIANYLGWKLVSDIFVFVKNIQYEFRGDCVLYLMQAQSSNHRAEHGVLNGAVGSMYVRKYFKPEWKTQVKEIVSYVKGAAKIFFQQSSIFSEASKKRAIEKLDAMQEYVAYPEEMLSKSAIDGYYRDLKMSNDQKENFANVAKFYVKKSFGRLGKIWNNDFWDLEVHQIVDTFNAFYSTMLNEFVITAGFLQDFNYAFNHPMYLNFAITGTTIGHEIFHGYDSEGMLYNKNGAKEPGQISSETSEKLRQYEKCVSNQYSGLEVKQLSNEYHINGNNTLRENLADIGGIRLAYYAYEIWTRNKSQEKTLPNLNFTTKQLFWIRSAQLHCSIIGDKRLKVLLEKDTYSPGGLRANGMLMFSNEFAKDFKCPTNSPMNPNEKCNNDHMWSTKINHKRIR